MSKIHHRPDIVQQATEVILRVMALPEVEGVQVRAAEVLGLPHSTGINILLNQGYLLPSLMHHLVECGELVIEKTRFRSEANFGSAHRLAQFHEMLADYGLSHSGWCEYQLELWLAGRDSK